MVHAVAPVEDAYVPSAQSVHAVSAVSAVYVPNAQPVHVVRPLVSAMLPGVHAVHVSGVADDHVRSASSLSHEYVADATLPSYPALHFHVIWCGCPLEFTVGPSCTAFWSGAPMAVHAVHAMSAGVQPPVVAPHDVGVGTTP